MTHGFSTRLGGVSEGIFESLNFASGRGDDPDNILENFKRIGVSLGDIPAKDMVYAKQTHTVNVLHVTEKHRGMGVTRERDFDNIDALVTDTPGVCLVAGFADCIPLFFADPVKQAIGLAHSGWRGTIGNIAAAQIAISKGLKGPSLTVSTACSSGIDAITTGIMLIEQDMADAVICVGAEAATSPLTILGLSSIHALSRNNEDPEHASRPFDLNRDGFVMAEGGGAVIIEKEESALKRDARIRCSVAGYANSTDGYHVTSPHPEGIAAIFCMKQSLEVAGLPLTAVDYINAHGTSTPKGDIIEVGAIKSLFGDHAYKLAVSSTKSSTGHLMGAGGTVETIACIKALEEDILPPTINQTTPDPECDLDFVPNEARKAPVNVAMCNAFGFGGQNASILLKKYQ